MSPKLSILAAAFIATGMLAAAQQSPALAESAASGASADTSSQRAHCVDVNGQVQRKAETTGAQTMSGGSSADKPTATGTAGGDSANAQVKPGPLPGSTTVAQQNQASNGPPC